MIEVGKKYKVVVNESLTKFGICRGDVLEVLKIVTQSDKSNHATVVRVHRDGDIFDVNFKDYDYFWCVFTDSMVETSQELYEIVETKPERSVEVAKSYLHSYGVESLEDRYNNWIVENIHVYELFCEFAIKAIQSGKKKISHWLIVNRLRWEVEIETKGTCYQDKDFKISNDYIAFLARDFMKDYPQYGEVFTIKQMKRV
ncbi:hypothetical protein [Acinetobacter phage vB_AbaM_CP14]|nr:hypothetical protein [Acinetobacter phage vB_AbaM_CP14]